MDCIWKRAESIPLLLQKWFGGQGGSAGMVFAGLPNFWTSHSLSLTATHSCRHCLHLLISVLNATRTFHKPRGTPTVVPSVSLAPLTFLQMFCQCIFEDHIVIPFSWRVWSTPPANVTCLNTQTNLISIPTLLELVAVIPLWICLRQAKVCTVHREQAVIEGILFLPILKQDLDVGVGWYNVAVSAQETNAKVSRITYNIVIQFKNCSNERPRVFVYGLWVLS